MATSSAAGSVPEEETAVDGILGQALESSALRFDSQQNPCSTLAASGGHALNSLGANTSSLSSESYHTTVGSSPLEADVFADDTSVTTTLDDLPRPSDPPEVCPACSCTSIESRYNNGIHATWCGSHLEEEEARCAEEDHNQETPVACQHGHIIGGCDTHTLVERSLAMCSENNCVYGSSSVDHKSERHEEGLEGDAEMSTGSSFAILRARKAVSTWCQDLDLDRLPNEILMHILSFLEVCDLLATSRTNHHFRSLSLHPILHHHRLRRVRLYILPSLLFSSPNRPSLADLIARHIFLTHTTRISRELSRSLVTIRLSRRLPLRPSAESLVQRGVLPSEVVEGHVAPALVARSRAVERERLKDGLRSWVGGVWKGRVKEREEGVRKWHESRGVGRVWKLRRFWERVSKDGSDSGVGIV